MPFFSSLVRDVRFAKRLSKIFARISDLGPESKTLVCDDLEKIIDQYPNKTAISFESHSLTYLQMETLANRYAHWAKARGLKPGDTVAVFLPNRLDYLPLWFGLSKVGVVSALINNALVGQGLAHCINISSASLTIVDPSTLEAFQAVKFLIERHQQLWCLDIDRTQETEEMRALEPALKGVSSVRVEKSYRDDITANKTILYIYTSGTTGMPKAAKISHNRAQLYMRAFAGLSGMKPGDKIYNVLPLYHATGGLCGTGAALLNGSELIVRKRFSATHFWPEIYAQKATHIVYIGELCRYLVNAPTPADPKCETGHKIKMVFGNGLRPEIWDEFKSRFAIPQIIEFYGSTEGNVSLFNLDEKPGAIGRVPNLVKSRINIRLVPFDIEKEEPIREANGFCRVCRPGEIGEAIGMIGTGARHAYSGYVDAKASQKKVLTSVFKKGDSWFRTGDLMRCDAEGYYYFVDRIGDTFRFKGENISTSEVAEYCAGAPGVDEAIVYGVAVPHLDGKAGMVSLLVQDEFDLVKFLDHIKSRLPAYSLPRFIRLLNHIETTGTFKYKKTDLVREGFNIEQISDEIFVLLNEDSYIKLTPELHAELQNNQFRI
jgi:fatty-acyl-CoA synthase